MNYILSIILIIIIILLGCIYWLFGTQTISGQVFIVTKGGGNVELGSLEIRYIEEKELLKLGNNLAVISQLISEFQKKVKAEEIKNGGSYKEDYDFSKSSSRDIELENEAENILLACLIDTNKTPLKLKEKLNDFKFALDKKIKSPISLLLDIADSGIIEKLSQNTYPKKVFFMGETIARTDSNGRFTAKIPLSKKGWLIAHGQRQVFNKEETYYWLEPITAETILLTNDNLWE